MFVLICPGGGYQNVMSCIEGEPIARQFNKKGFAAFVLRYRCKKKGRFPVPQDDVARAVKEILANSQKWNVGSENYAVCGFSAGGHVAAGFGTEAFGYKAHNLPKPGALILCYPVVTMAEHTHRGSRNNLLGKYATDKQKAYASIENQITPNYPPTFLWNSEQDKLVDPCNSQMMAEALAKNNVPYEYVRYKTGVHGIGLGIGTECESWVEKAIAFWQRQK